MSKMKKALVLAAAILFPGVASAADMAVKARPLPPPAPIFTWTGFYVGVNGGWAFDGWDDNTGNLVAFSAGFAAPIAGGAVPVNRGARHEGGFGGGQIGYNWQANQFVFGLEADIQGADIGRTNTIFFPGGGGFVPVNNTARDHIDWFGT